MLCMALLASGTFCVQAGEARDDAFQSAREAFAKGDRGRLARAQAALGDHPLAPWVEYFRLSLQLQDGGEGGISAFVARHEGGYLAEKMRGAWLRQFVKRGEWAQVRELYGQLKRPDAEMQCLGLAARLRLGETAAQADAAALLDAPAALGEPCIAQLDSPVVAAALPEESLWQRLRRQVAQGRFKEARTLSGWLPASAKLSWRAIDPVMDHPARHLAKLADGFHTHRSSRELAMLAVLRMARSDVRVAAARWTDIESRFEATERGFVWGQLALRAALGHLPETGGWFDRAAELGAAFDEEQGAWRIRAALRAEDWRGVARAIDALPAGQATQPEWIYWRGRAHAAHGETAPAQAAYARIAGPAGFYGILAREALGRPFALPPRATPPSDAELAAAATTPGLERGLLLIRTGMRIDGVREWIWAIDGMNDRQLLAASTLAQRHEVIDRSINTADRTQAEHDYSLRYPLPFYVQVEPRVREVNLDPAWVYGLMRQESRFIMDAQSSAGAKGLMQLMPATARWVAKKIGMERYHPGRVTDMDINVTLGTNYMRMVLDGLDNHPVLASAAYNAGPGRARKWRAERPIEGAIYAETIPFNETRDYVKKVMANATHYAALLGGPAPTLTDRLGRIRPRGFGDTTAEDLP
jgi:soluble lytic murein transglycosylase